jgi:hypothetical protein
MANGSIWANQGNKVILNRTFKASPDYTAPSVLKIGIGSTTPVASDTDLVNPVPIDSTESVDDCDTSDWSDSADMTTSLNSTTYKEGEGSLNLTKDGTASANASTSKTTTSRDFTSKGLSIWIYIKDSTDYGKLATSNCLEIRFGSDSSNYYYWQKDKADLTTGWNLIQELTSSNADGTTGSPTIASCDYTFVQLTADASATTWSAGDFIMDDIKLVSSGDYILSLSSGYPVLDETNLQATFRATLNTLQANGYPLREFGLFNTDSSRIMVSRSVHTEIDKTNQVEVSYVEKDKLD